MNERKIGEVFVVKGVRLRCVEGFDCHNCHFNGSGCCQSAGECCTVYRRDGKNVIFKEYSTSSIIEVDE